MHPGPPPPPGVVQVVSTDCSGNPGMGMSFDPVLSENGRFVAFDSSASNLVAFGLSGTGRFAVFTSSATNLTTGGNPAAQVFVRDTCIGAANCTPKTVVISVDPSGNFVGGTDASISSDSHFAAFVLFSGPNTGQILLARTGF